MNPYLMDRRNFLTKTWNGIGYLSLASMLARQSAHGNRQNHIQVAHLPRKAKNCIFLFMQGGVSQMDSFEYKPELNRLHGKPIPRGLDVSGELQGRLSFEHVCIGSPFNFSRHGQSGRYFSELFPNLSSHADELAFIHGIKTDNQNHGPSTLHVTTGSQFPGSPSVGSWISYGLGTENSNLPGYVVIQDPRGAPVNGAAVWANGYLPATHQGTLLRSKGTPILNLKNAAGLSFEQQRQELDALRWLNNTHLSHRDAVDGLEARISSYELAFRMQMAAPELMDLSNEPQHIKTLYGMDNSQTAGFGRQCLLARRLVERGVRHTLLIHGVQIGGDSWDDHGNVKGGMIKHCREVDKPISGLLTDLKQSGLLDETLVVWASEMGRTPFRNGGMVNNPGREHNSYGLAMWMAGGNVKPGSAIGQTDEFSLRSIGEPIHIRDVHATILDLMGLKHDELTYLHSGRIRKLTDIGGNVLSEMIS